MSITFGSVGDIIAVGQIAWSLAKALTDSNGSAKEYQGLIKELKAFHNALLQIVALWQNYESSPALQQLGTLTKDSVKEWGGIFVAFREKIDKKYGTTLSVGGSGNWVKDAGRKVSWLKEKEDILDLRRKLGSASGIITMLTLAAMGKSNKLAESVMEGRVHAVNCLLQESKKLAEEHITQLKLLDDKIERQSKTSDFILASVRSGIPTLTQVYSMVIDIKNLLGLFQSHMTLQQSTPRGIGNVWQQDPVILEDAFGYRIPLPLEVVTSWRILDVILSERFENRPGHQKVLRGEYAIEEGITGRDINRENELSLSFCPGQKIDMSMIFSDANGSTNCCPRCGTESEALAEIRTQCTSCQMWFQRLIEIDSDSESETESVAEPTHPLVATPDSVRTTKPKAAVSTPADFQRVRLLSTLRLREQKAKEDHNSQNLQDILDKIDHIVDGIRAGSPWNVLTDDDDDKETTWRQFRRELMHEGFSSDVLFQHKDAIRSNLQAVLRDGPANGVPTDPGAPRFKLSSVSVEDYESDDGAAHVRTEFAKCTPYTHTDISQSPTAAFTNDGRARSNQTKQPPTDDSTNDFRENPLPPKWDDHRQYAVQYMQTARRKAAESLGSTVGRGSKRVSLFPLAMQAQMEDYESDSVRDTGRGDIRQGSTFGAVNQNPFRPPREIDGFFKTGHRMFDDTFAQAEISRNETRFPSEAGQAQTTTNLAQSPSAQRKGEDFHLEPVAEPPTETDDFMNSIREVATFAWSLAGSDGYIASHGHGVPRGEETTVELAEPS